MSCHFTKKALRMINFQPCSSHSNRLFKTSFVLKFSDKVNLENTFFVSKSINNLLPSLFDDWFLFSSDQHSYKTFWYFRGNLYESSYKTNFYDKNSIIGSPINAWNNSQKLLKFSLRHLIKSKMPFLQIMELIVNFQTFQIDAWWFFKDLTSISILTFSPRCCYFIIYILLYDLPLINWTKLLLLSILEVDLRLQQHPRWSTLW